MNEKYDVKNLNNLDEESLKKVNNLLDSIFKENCQLGNYKINLTANDNTLRIVIHKAKKNNSQEAPLHLMTSAECELLRNHFQNYIKSLDDDVFSEACSSFKANELNKLSDIVEESSDPDTLKQTFNIFYKAVDTVIVNKVARLKSQMNKGFIQLNKPD